MSKIAVIREDDFDDSGYTESVKAFKEKEHDIIHVGIDQSVVTDDNLVTSRNPSDLPDFIQAVLEKPA